MEGDACLFTPPEEHSKADVVTFSYALSMIPNFFAAVDQALNYLDDAGIVGACDFYVSAKYATAFELRTLSALSTGMTFHRVKCPGSADISGY